MNPQDQRDANENVANESKPVVEKPEAEDELKENSDNQSENETAEGRSEEVNDDSADNEILRNKNSAGDTDNLSQHFMTSTGDEGAVGNTVGPDDKMTEKERDIDSYAVEINQEKSDIEASPENVDSKQKETHETENAANTKHELDSVPLGNISDPNETQRCHEVNPELHGTVRRPGSSMLRKRRDMALQETSASFTQITDIATVANTDSGNAGDKNGIAKKEPDLERTEKKLLDQTAEGTNARDVTMRYSIQETDQYKISEIPVDASETSENMETEDVVLREKNEEDEQDRKSRARQSCEEMDYSEDEIEWAVNQYKHDNRGNEDYDGHDLAQLMEDRRDDVHDAQHNADSPCDLGAPHVPGPQHGNLTTQGGQYCVMAKINDLGHPQDGSSEHVIQIEVPPEMTTGICNQGCIPKFVLTINSP